MKAFRNFVILLGLALFLVPFKNVYALTKEQSHVNDWFEVQEIAGTTSTGRIVISTTGQPKLMNENGYIILYNDTTQPITYKRYYEKKDLTWNDSGTNATIQPSGKYSTGLKYADCTFIATTYPLVNKDTGENILQPSYDAKDLRIVLPVDSYHKDTTDSINVWLTYTVPINTDPTKVTINVASPTLDNNKNNITLHNYNKTTGNGTLHFNLYDVPVGVHNIDITVNGLTKRVIYERLGGVVDENGDGIDDRTNLPVDNGHAPEVPDEDFIKNSIVTLKDFTKEFQGFQTFITGFLGVFPSWITLPIATLFTVLVIMTIVKIIRG